MGFTGFPIEGIEFFEQLEADNSRAFWLENKHRHAQSIKQPMAELADRLGDYGPFHIYRPYNDLRFSKNKPPYKLHQGMYGELEGGSGHYVHLSGQGLLAGAGYYSMAKDQLKRFREMIDADATGTELETLVADAKKRRYTIGAVGELKTAPRGYSKDHQRIALLRLKGLIVSKDFGSPKWIHTAEAAKRIRDAWESAAQICQWLDAHVGPSTEPPDDRPF